MDEAMDNQRLAELDGATFELSLYMATHSNVCFRVTELPEGYADLCFHNTWLIDCPTTMHRVTVRRAEPIISASARKRFSEETAKYLERSDVYVFSCEEGQYSIWAEAASFDWHGKLIVWLTDQGVDQVVNTILNLPLNE
jgi:hypothetical protein